MTDFSAQTLSLSDDDCRILRPLLYMDDGISCSQLAAHTGLEETKAQEICSALINQKILTRESDGQLLKINSSPSYLKAIHEAVGRYELKKIRKRAKTAKYHAAARIQNIDELADMIMHARKDYRS